MYTEHHKLIRSLLLTLDGSYSIISTTGKLMLQSNHKGFKNSERKRNKISAKQFQITKQINLMSTKISNSIGLTMYYHGTENAE